MLELRPTCEHCNTPLPPSSTEAMICSFECTFCQTCVRTVLHDVCPNCGGGVTAGIDFGLHLAAVLRGEDVAKQIQLELEYNPQPPFDSGTPATAPGDVVTAVRTRAEPLQARRLATCQAIARRAGRP